MAAHDLSLPLRQLEVNRPGTSATSSPLSSAPQTPGLNTPRRPSHTAISPSQQQATNSPRPPNSLRRTSSAANLGQRSASSPKLVRKASRQSMGAQTPAVELEKRPTPKRSISNLIANLREAQSTMESIEEPLPLTAADIAVLHFARELEAHGREDVQAETVVIMHDACYRHRYSRLKTTKSTLGMIVERPERLHASAMGAAAAYVRLGEHHAGGRNAPNPDRRDASTPPFKIMRTARQLDITSSYVTNVHGTSWMSELQTMCHLSGERLAAGLKELSRSSTPTDPEKRKLHEGDLYLCPESLSAFQGALGGVADAIDTIFNPTSNTSRAFVAIRPPGHHCSADYPSGFCWLNNVHVGIEYAAQTYGLTHAAIIDFDLHHGDGSQAITWERNSRNNQRRVNAKPNSKVKLNPDIGYYSLHDINSYPCEMGDDEKVQAASLCVENAHGQSVWNVHLLPWRTEEEFWSLYESRYKILLEKARMFLRHHTDRLKTEGRVQPKAAIFISAGFDASEWEGAGMQRHKVNVPTEFYARFTRDIVEMAQEEGLGCGGRVISVLEGGYSDRALCSGVMSHLSGLCAVPVEAPDLRNAQNDTSLDQMMHGLRINGSQHPKLYYSREWWSASNLTALEHRINPPPPPAPGKKLRAGPQPTYATPTESFAYKVIDPAKFARSISGTMREAPSAQEKVTEKRPAPAVDWVTATQELVKFLVPEGPESRSCTAEELGGVKVKKERVSTTPTSAEETGAPMKLRDRKAKVQPGVEKVRSVSRGEGRRQTVHDFSTLALGDAKETEVPRLQQQRRMSRRLSAGSTLSSLDGVVEDGEPPPVPALPFASRSGMAPPAANGMGGVDGGVQVKKTRLPTAGKKTTSGTPITPTFVPLDTADVAVNGNNDSKQASQALDQGKPPSQGAGDVDGLTSNMKKITLKVGSKDEHDRKLREKEAAERRARALKGAETRRVNAAARKAAAATEGAKAAQPPLVAPKPATVTAQEQLLHQAASKEQQGGSGVMGGDVNEFEKVRGVLPNQPIANATEGLFASARAPPQIPDYAASLPRNEWSNQPTSVFLAPVNTAPVNTTPEHSNGFHEASATARKVLPAIVPPGSAARPLAQDPNSSSGSIPASRFSSSSPAPRSPSTMINGRRLPTWSSTGPIPFAAAAAAAVPLPASPTTNKASFRSPKSPPMSPWQRQHMRDASWGSTYGDGNGVSRSMLTREEISPEREEAKHAEKVGDNEWEVPETPKQVG